MDALSSFLSLYKPGGSLDTRCHLHAPWELEHQLEATGTAPYHVVVNGTAVLILQDREPIPLRSGDIVVLPRGSAHRLLAHHHEASATVSNLCGQEKGGSVKLKTNTGNGAMTDILCGTFVFDQPAGKGLLATLPELLVVNADSTPGFATLGALVGMLRAETEGQRAGAHALVAGLSSLLFGMLIRAWIEQEDSLTGLLGVFAVRRLQPALLAMFDHMDADWSLAELAELCHMSRATFTRLFQQAAHTSATVALLQIRMAHAAQWLIRDDRTVGAIGEAVGYRSEAAFGRAFKKSFGIGPGQYRRHFRAHSTAAETAP